MAITTAPISGSSDLSIQAFNGIFGQNWFTMDPDVTGSATIIVKMLAMLNELSMFAVTALFAAVYMVAVVGTAHEGTPLGKKFHSFWVPVRFTLATGMLIPVKSGLCLFQLLLLTTVGWSVHFADELWKVFLDSSVQSSIISVVKDDEVPAPLRAESEKIARDVLSNLVVYKYLQSEYDLQGGLLVQSEEDQINLQHYTYQFQDPATLIDDHRAFGSVEIMCRSLQSCNDESNAVVALIKDIEPIALDIVRRGTGKIEEMPSTGPFKAAVDRFINAQKQIIKNTYEKELNRLEKDANFFLDEAKSMGWIGAGSFYHTILGMQSKAMELSRINVTSSPPSINAKHDGYRQYENTMRVAAAYAGNTDADIKKYISAAKAGGSISLIEMVFGERLNVKVVGMAAGWMTDGDPIHAMSRLGNYIIGAVDTSIAMFTMLKATTAGVKDAKEASWFASAVDGTLTQGAISGTLGGFQEILNTLSVLFWMIVIALWGVAHVLAFYLPAVPFIFWVSGVIGWMIMVVEAMVAVPIWIVAHAMPEGEGLAGERGKQGYLLMLGILVRPFLMLLGLCIAMVLMGIVGKLIGGLFIVYVASFESQSGFIMPIHSMVAYLVMLGAIMIIFTHKLFGMISYLPDQVLRWVGGHSPSLGEGADENKAHLMVGGLVSRTENAMRGGAGAAAGKDKRTPDGEKKNTEGGGAGSAKGEVSQKTQQLAPGDKSGGRQGDV